MNEPSNMQEKVDECNTLLGRVESDLKRLDKVAGLQNKLRSLRNHLAADADLRHDLLDNIQEGLTLVNREILHGLEVKLHCHNH